MAVKIEFQLNPRLLSNRNAASYLGISERTFDELSRKKKFPGPVRIGRRKLWDRVAIDRYFDEIIKDNLPSRSAQNGSEVVWT